LAVGGRQQRLRRRRIRAGDGDDDQYTGRSQGETARDRPGQSSSRRPAKAFAGGDARCFLEGTRAVARIRPGRVHRLAPTASPPAVNLGRRRDVIAYSLAAPAAASGTLHKEAMGTGMIARSRKFLLTLSLLCWPALQA